MLGFQIINEKLLLQFKNLLTQKNSIENTHTNPDKPEDFKNGICIHYQYYYRKDNVSVRSVVHSPNFNTTKTYKLTEYGMTAMSNCKMDPNPQHPNNYIDI